MFRAWILMAAAVLSATAARGAALDAEAVNGAELGAAPARHAKGIDPATVKAQVLLDRARFSPGEIDGRGGENARKAIAAFQAAQGLSGNGKLDRATWDRLNANDHVAVLTEYTIAEKDVKGPFLAKLPARMEDMKDLDHLGYTSPREALAEKFHMSERLLAALNPGKAFDRAGETILVANVGRPAPGAKAVKVEVDKVRKDVRAYGQDGGLLAVYPASIGSREKPAPSGDFKVTSIAHNPTYHYNPEYQFKGVRSQKPFTVKPGPNNPVGSVWINLSAKSYGIHGTPEPSKVSKTASHGCIRLTNWDAADLAAMLRKGTPVAFLDQGEGREAMASVLDKPQHRSRHGRSVRH